MSWQLSQNFKSIAFPENSPNDSRASMSLWYSKQNSDGPVTVETPVETIPLAFWAGWYPENRSSVAQWNLKMFTYNTFITINSFPWKVSPLFQIDTKQGGFSHFGLQKSTPSKLLKTSFLSFSEHSKTCCFEEKKQNMKTPLVSDWYKTRGDFARGGTFQGNGLMVESSGTLPGRFSCIEHSAPRSSLRFLEGTPQAFSPASWRYCEFVIHPEWSVETSKQNHTYVV